MTPVHRLAAVFVVLLPVAGSLGLGDLRFTMYARPVWFRLEMGAEDAQGTRRKVAPASLAPHVDALAFPWLAGADHFRRTYDVTALSRRLEDLGHLVCAVDPLHPRRVDVALETKTSGPEIARRQVEALCP